MKTNKKTSIIKNKYVISIFAILIYVFFGIVSFPNSESVKDFNLLYYVLLAIFTLFILSFIYFKDIKNDFNKFKKNIFKNILLCFGVFICCFLIVIIGNNLTFMITHVKDANTISLIFPNMKTLLYYTLFVMLIYTPIVESLIFNKTLKNLIKNDILFTIVSALLFGLMQIGINLSNVNTIISSIPYMIVGAIMAILYVKKKNIFFPIVTWFIYYSFQLFIQSSVYWA